MSDDKVELIKEKVNKMLSNSYDYEKHSMHMEKIGMMSDEEHGNMHMRLEARKSTLHGVLQMIESIEKPLETNPE